MLDILIEAEKDLPRLLSDPEWMSRWKSLHIDYELPVVDRLSFDWRSGLRLSLHKIYPCLNGKVLFHPHPWPSAMKIVQGAYKMDVGYGAGVERPSVSLSLILGRGSSYAMPDPDIWHSVEPISRPAYTIMVTGPRWERSSPVPDHPLRELIAEEKISVWAIFVAEYCQSSFSTPIYLDQ